MDVTYFLTIVTTIHVLSTKHDVRILEDRHDSECSICLDMVGILEVVPASLSQN